jgi:chorismate dehydratase
MRQVEEQQPATRLGAIAFVNTLPIYMDYPPPVGTEVIYGPPSALNRAMLAGELDVSPVSSAFYLRHRDRFVLLEDLSVSSPGAVESVLFLSRVPMGPDLWDLSSIGVPDASETSIALLAHFLQKACGGSRVDGRFEMYPAKDYQQALADKGAVLIIGDDALQIIDEGVPPGYYCYDLASLWVEDTGLPFVFAVWVAQKAWAKANGASLAAMNQGLCWSRDRFLGDEALLERGVRMASTRCTISPERLRHYFTRSLSYTLSGAHQQALGRFDEILKALDAPLDAQMKEPNNLEALHRDRPPAGVSHDRGAHPKVSL